ncbi:hypothetical protein GCM10023168_11290 [Fodinibacter luteus]|uniref:Transcriptional regulator, AbiEi antitoxin, Type IV TA system n=1 Tax=Fodinibacter luteus TaxID=552064 RepID=A0ABP8K856_9MICO
MPEFPPVLQAVLARQDNVVTRAQLFEHGITYPTVRWNAGRGWRILLPQVYGTFREQPTVRQRQVAALLWAGPGSVLAGPTAARLHGVTSAEPLARVHVLVPAPRSSRTSGFCEVRRTLLHDPCIVTRGPLRLSSPARAAVDAARAARTPDARAAILIEAVQRGIASVDDLAEWVHRLRPRDAASLHAPLAEAASGAWSVPESELLDLVATSLVLPTPWPNPVVTSREGIPLTSPDAWFDDVGMAVMVHSYRYHGEGDAWDDTVDKDGDLVGVGVVVAGVTPRRIRERPDAVLARLERAYASARTRPRPAVRAVPRHLAALRGTATPPAGPPARG